MTTPMKWRNALLISLALVALALAAAWVFRGQLALHGMRAAMDRAMGDDDIAALPDGLHVGLCGTGSPMADISRAGPCTVVIAGRRVFVVDSGSGSTRNLTLMNLPPARVEAALLTHFHSDHIADLGELMLQRWAAGANTAPLPVYGGPRVEQIVAGFQTAYGPDRGYRIAHHGPKVTPPSGFGGVARPFPIGPGLPDVVLIDDHDLKITAFAVNHGPVEPAVGYRFAYKGRSLVISGDAAPNSPRLAANAKGADLLVHEALQAKLVNMQREAALKFKRENLAAILHDILDYHTTPEQAADIAQTAGVRTLLLTHIIPPAPVEAMEGPFLGDARKHFKGQLLMGHDGDFLSLPAGSDKIERRNLMHQLF